jgi:hypothetical protein
MKISKSCLSAALAVCFCLLSATSFAQSPKEKALKTIEDAFFTRFISSEVYHYDSKSPMSYNYEITDTCILILRKTNGATQDITWFSLTFDKINYISAVEKENFFKKNTGLKMKCKSSYYKAGKGKVNGRGEAMYGIDAVIMPFAIGKGDTVVASLIRAVNIIMRENRKEKKLASAKLATDKLFLTDAQLKQTAYYQLPEYEIFTADSAKVTLGSYLQNNRKYNDKPTLMITWSYKWCKPCMKIIDSLLESGAALAYNIVLMNRDKEMFDDKLQMGFAELKGYISGRTPNYNKNAILLFDRNDQLADLDNGELPLFTWLDKSMMIIGTYSGFEITPNKILAILSGINSGKIAFGFVKYYDANGLPCNKENAYKRTDFGIMAADKTLYQLTVYNVSDDKLTAVAYYRKDEAGRFIRREKK